MTPEQLSTTLVHALTALVERGDVTLPDGVPPAAEYVRDVYERVAPLLAEAGLMSQDARAGCVRCQACSALSTFERAFGGGRDGVPAGPPARDRAA